jgi:transketolase
LRNAVLKQIARLAMADDRVVFIGSDMQYGTRELLHELDDDRFIMEGISEQQIIGMAAGLALEGFVPFVSGIATFLTRRALEQIVVDLCLQNAPVRLLGSGGGLTYSSLGPTHMATDDIGLMTTLPNMTVVAPRSVREACALVRSTMSATGPVYIRLSKQQGGDDDDASEQGVALGVGVLLRPAGDVLIVATGTMSDEALKAVPLLAAAGLETGVLHLPTIKPIDKNLIVSSLPGVRLLVTLEEGLCSGGLGSAVVATVVSAGAHRNLEILTLGLPDRYLSDYGGRLDMLTRLGLTADGIARSIVDRLDAQRLGHRPMDEIH